jgi:hypothetical protein
MVQENDVIAIIVIILFFILALIAFGIYHLVSLARGGESSGSESESGTRSLVDDWSPWQLWGWDVYFLGDWRIGWDIMNAWWLGYRCIYSMGFGVLEERERERA